MNWMNWIECIPMLKNDWVLRLFDYFPSIVVRSINSWMMVGKNEKRGYFPSLLQFLKAMTFCQDHVRMDYASRLGSIYAYRKWKSLGVSDILKWPKWAQPNVGYFACIAL